MVVTRMEAMEAQIERITVAVDRLAEQRDLAFELVKKLEAVYEETMRELEQAKLRIEELEGARKTPKIQTKGKG